MAKSSGNFSSATLFGLCIIKRFRLPKMAGHSLHLVEKLFKLQKLVHLVYNYVIECNFRVLLPMFKKSSAAKPLINEP